MKWFERLELSPGRRRVVEQVVAALLALVAEQGHEAVQVGHERSDKRNLPLDFLTHCQSDVRDS